MTKTEKGFYIRALILLVLVIYQTFIEGDKYTIADVEGFSVSYVIAMAYFIYFCVYILTLKCMSCGEPVIYKSVNPSGWTLPGSKCDKCGQEF